MDCSINIIDLQYFTPNQVYSKLFNNENNKNTNNISYINSKEFVFYRKRILQLVKDLVRGNINESILVESFQDFTYNAINYFKFTDKADMIQETYPIDSNSNLNTNQKNKLPPIHESEEEMFGNQLLYKEKVAPLTKKLDDFIVRKSEKVQQHIIPKQRSFDLKQESLRVKGVDAKKKMKKKKQEK